MQWMYQDKPMVAIPEGAKAFVYLLIIHYEGQEYKYIGMKGFYSTSRKKITGKSRRQVTVKESNWKAYRSSSESIKSMLKHGGTLTSMEVLHICRTVGEALYLEAKEQINREVLCDPQYLNKWIKITTARCYKNEDTD